MNGFPLTAGEEVLQDSSSNRVIFISHGQLCTKQNLFSILSTKVWLPDFCHTWILLCLFFCLPGIHFFYHTFTFLFTYFEFWFIFLIEFFTAFLLSFFLPALFYNHPCSIQSPLILGSFFFSFLVVRGWVMLSEGLISSGLWWGRETTQVAASDAQTERRGPAWISSIHSPRVCVYPHRH